MRCPVILACLFALGCGPLPDRYPPPPPPPPAPNVTVSLPSRSGMVIVVPGRPVAADAIPARWQGEWETDSGYRCTFELTLAVDPNGVIDGVFRWTLRDAPRTSTQHERIGQSGNEWVRGAFDPQSRQLTLVGYAVDAPKLLVADRYVLVIDAAGSSFSGKSEGEGGRWADRLRARVVPTPEPDADG